MPRGERREQGRRADPDRKPDDRRAGRVPSLPGGVLHVLLVEPEDSAGRGLDLVEQGEQAGRVAGLVVVAVNVLAAPGGGEEVVAAAAVRGARAVSRSVNSPSPSKVMFFCWIAS